MTLSSTAQTRRDVLLKEGLDALERAWVVIPLVGKIPPPGFTYKDRTSTTPEESSAWRIWRS